MKDNKNLQNLRSMETNKLCYICSPLRWDIEKNLKYAKQLAIDITMEWYIPIVPHLYFTTFLNDENEDERKMGMKMGLDILKLCSYYYIWDAYWISPWMKEEIKLSEKLKLIKI